MTYFSPAWPVASSPRGAEPGKPAGMLRAEEGGRGLLPPAAGSPPAAAAMAAGCPRGLHHRRVFAPATCYATAPLRAAETPFTERQDNPLTPFPCIYAVRSSPPPSLGFFN